MNDLLRVDTEHRDFPICPKCGHEEFDAWEIHLGLCGDGETDCGSCGYTMLISRHCSITYTTKAKE